MALTEESQNNGANEALSSGNNLWLIDAVVGFGRRKKALTPLKKSL